MAQITKDMTIYEVLQMDNEVAPILFSFGMQCLGCPGARAETLERAAASHGVDVEDMLTALNKHFADK